MENTPKNPVRDYEVYLQRQVADATSGLEFVQTNRRTLEKLGLKFSLFGTFLDFDHLQRPDVLRVIKAFGGRWSKQPGYDGGLNYTRDETVTGRRVRVYNGEPPPSCKIVEKVKYVKVPAKRERVVTRYVVCSDGTERKL
jgi:hypothetical protein